MFTATKRFAGYPFAHRAPFHDGHCSLIHGHNWAFTFTFAANSLEKGTDFVIDFGKLDFIKRWLADNFDHTLVLNADDPYLEYLRSVLRQPECGPAGMEVQTDRKPFAKIVAAPSCSCEGLAKWLHDVLNPMVQAATHNRVYIISLEVEEGEKNKATYRAASALFAMMDSLTR